MTDPARSVLNAEEIEDAQGNAAHAERFRPAEQLPSVLAGLLRASKPTEGPIPEPTLELVHLRVSQINACAFCCDLHTRRALAAGADDLVVRALPGWEELQMLTPIDRAALAVAEALTALDGRADLRTALDDGYAILGEAGFAQIIGAVATINAWNRLMLGAGSAPDPSYS